MFPVRGIRPHRSAGLRKARESVLLQTDQQSEMWGEVGFKLKERYIFIYEFFYSHFLLSCSFIYSHLMIEDIFWSLLLSDQHSSFKDNNTLLKVWKSLSRYKNCLEAKFLIFELILTSCIESPVVQISGSGSIRTFPSWNTWGLSDKALVTQIV